MSAPRPLAQHLESPTDEARISRMWRVIRAQRQSTPRRSSAWLAVPLAAAVVGALAWVAWPDADVVPTPRATAPVEASPPAVAWTVPARFDAPEARRFELPDGSTIALDAGSRLTTIESGDEQFVTLLERGRATFEVQPGGPRRWIVEGGLATVEVVGTVFTVERREGERREGERREGEVEVTVQRGVVLVRGERVPDRVARLVRGDRIVVRAEPEAAPSPAPVAGPPVAPSPRVRRPAPPAEDVGELVAAAADAQRNGDLDEAAGLLRRAMAHDDPRAAIAAYTLGRLEMDQLHRPARARVALQRALAIGLPERMAQQAERRLEQLR